MAKDKFPIPADLASGDMRIKGTAVLIRLLYTCAYTPWEIKNNIKEPITNFFIPQMNNDAFLMFLYYNEVKIVNGL